MQIIQPSVNFISVPFNELKSSVNLTCSLNIDIPSGVTVTWFFRGFPIIIEPPNEVITVDNSTTLVIRNPQQSDVGDYQCLFMGLDLERRPVITLGKYVTAINYVECTLYAINCQVCCMANIVQWLENTVQ